MTLRWNPFLAQLLAQEREALSRKVHAAKHTSAKNKRFEKRQKERARRSAGHERWKKDRWGQPWIRQPNAPFIGEDGER